MTKKLAFLTLLCTLALGVASANAQNLLGNPSVDDFPDPDVFPWTLTETQNPANPTVNAAELVDFGLVNAMGQGGSRHSGPLGLWLRGFEGLFNPGPFPNTSEVNAVLTQTVPGTAGQRYSFTGWARFETNYSGGVTTLAATAPGGARPSPTVSTFAIEFLDAGNAVIGGNSLDLRSVVTAGGPWAQGVVSRVSPAGTASVRVTASALRMVPNIDPGQSGFYDDFSLTANPVPEPGTLALAGLALVGLAIRRRK